MFADSIMTPYILNIFFLSNKVFSSKVYVLVWGGWWFTGGVF